MQLANRLIINAWMRFTLPASELLFYALFLRELLTKKESSIAHWKEIAEDSNSNLGGYRTRYYYAELPVDINRLEYFVNECISALWDVLTPDEYTKLQKKTAARVDRFTDSNLEKLLVLVENYKDENVAAFLEKAVG